MIYITFILALISAPLLDGAIDTDTPAQWEETHKADPLLLDEQDGAFTHPPANISDSEVSKEHPLETDHISGELMKLIGSIAFFTLILLALNWALKRINQNRFEQLNATSDIRVLEKRALSHKSMVYMIEIRNKTIAVAESAAGVAVLAEFEELEASPEQGFEQ